ncbi:MAG: response regulator transcription factor [Anaerolineae bacterium]|nr:response regulator transcription factor [Anaerolineae bacterium]
MDERPVRVLIADGNTASRKGLRPEIAIAGEADEGQEAVRLTAEQRPDVVVIDAQMPGIDGIEAVRRIKACTPQTRVVVVAMYAAYRGKAAAAGADAFVHKTDPPERLIAAILRTRFGLDSSFCFSVGGHHL